MDLIGQRFGRWTVVGLAESKIISNHKSICWHCVCDCGTERDVLQRSLRSGETKSCGCLHKEIVNSPNIKNRKENTYVFFEKYLEIYDSSGNKTLCDLDQYESLKDYYWYSGDSEYWIANDRNIKNKKIRLNRFLCGVLDNNSVVVDHIDGDVSNNMKSNLRKCSIKENNINNKVQSTNTSGYTGVSKAKKDGTWRAYITVNGKQINLGIYCNKEDAVKARKVAENKYFGEFSYDNSQSIGRKNKENINE